VKNEKANGKRQKAKVKDGRGRTKARPIALDVMSSYATINESLPAISDEQLAMSNHEQLAMSN
jgi:hypothetical protein